MTAEGTCDLCLGSVKTIKNNKGKEALSFTQISIGKITSQPLKSRTILFYQKIKVENQIESSLPKSGQTVLDIILVMEKPKK